MIQAWGGKEGLDWAESVQAEFERVREKEHVRKEVERHRVTVKKMAKDDQRTKRQREVESCFAEALPTILEDLQNKCSSKTEMVSKMNDRLAANGYEDSLSRPTLYNWLRDHNMI